MKTVGIIGGSGFIGSHTTKKFLQEGFKVKVSATDISKTEKYNHLKELPNAENLEILPLKVENKNQLKEHSCFIGAKTVFTLASFIWINRFIIKGFTTETITSFL
jgi:UDP-glucose 4-epimerase